MALVEATVSGWPAGADPRHAPSLAEEAVLMVRAVASAFADLATVVIPYSSNWQDSLAGKLAGGSAILVATPVESVPNLLATSELAVVIAPEFEGLLTEATERLSHTAAIRLCPDASFVAATSSKRRTAERLRELDVPCVPTSCDPPGEDATWPLVFKPDNGAGAAELRIEHSPRAAGTLPAGFCWQPFLPGRPASVMCLSGPAGTKIFPPCWQCFGAAGGLASIEVIRDSIAHDRAIALARRVAERLAPDRGVWGIDMLLGSGHGADEDLVLEINPRVVTSFALHAARSKSPLGGAWLRAIRGEPCQLEFNDRPSRISVNGRPS